MEIPRNSQKKIQTRNIFSTTFKKKKVMLGFV